MAKEIDPSKLHDHLWRTGPYICFYETKNDEFNLKLVDYVNKMAKTYPDLKIFIVNWKKKRDFNPYTPDEEMNTIYLFFDGNEIEKMYCPNHLKINQLFEKAVNYYNQNIDRRIENVGSIIMRENLKETDILGNTTNYLSKSDIGKIRRRISWLKGKKIKFIYDQTLDFTEDKKEQLFNNSVNIESKCCKNKCEYACLDTEIFKNFKEIPQSKMWYQEVKMTELPSEFLIEEPEAILPQKYELQNDVLNNNLFLSNQKSIPESYVKKKYINEIDSQISGYSNKVSISKSPKKFFNSKKLPMIKTRSIIHNHRNKYKIIKSLKGNIIEKRSLQFPKNRKNILNFKNS